MEHGYRPRHEEPYAGDRDEIMGFWLEPTGRTRRRWSWWRLRHVSEQEMIEWATVDYLALVKVMDCDLHDYRQRVLWIKSPASPPNSEKEA